MKEALTSEKQTPAAISVMAMEVMRSTYKSIEDALIGRMVRVTSDHNGQPYGHSRKSWRGEVCRIKHVHIDLTTSDRRDAIQLALEGHEYECCIPANEVEFV